MDVFCNSQLGEEMFCLCLLDMSKKEHLNLLLRKTKQNKKPGCPAY